MATPWGAPNNKMAFNKPGGALAGLLSGANDQAARNWAAAGRTGGGGSLAGSFQNPLQQLMGGAGGGAGPVAPQGGAGPAPAPPPPQPQPDPNQPPPGVPPQVPPPEGLPYTPDPSAPLPQMPPGYAEMNQALQTMPIATALGIMQSGGLGPAGMGAIGQLMGMGGTGTNPWMEQAAGGFQNIGEIDPRNIGTAGRFGSIYNRAGQQGMAQKALGDVARGSMLEAGGNPYIEDVISRGQQDVSDQMAQMFSGGGRYGSGAHQGVTSEAVAGLANQLRAENYENERARQMQAAGMISGEQAGRMGIQQGAAQGLTGVQGQNIANQMASQGQNIQNQLSASGALGQLGQQAFGNQQGALMNAAGIENLGTQNVLNTMSQLPGIQANKIFDAQQQMQAGQQLDQRSQQQLNDLINMWSQGDMQDWSRLGGLLSASGQAAGPWGTKTGQTTSQAPGMNPLGMAGGALSLLGGKSDIRLKHDIEPDGEEKGIPVYTFRYRFGLPAMIGRVRGVMAQEVSHIIPQAVRRDGDGYLSVEYTMLGMRMELA